MRNLRVSKQRKSNSRGRLRRVAQEKIAELSYLPENLPNAKPATLQFPSACKGRSKPGQKPRQAAPNRAESVPRKTIRSVSTQQRRSLPQGKRHRARRSTRRIARFL